MTSDKQTLEFIESAINTAHAYNAGELVSAMVESQIDLTEYGHLKDVELRYDMDEQNQLVKIVYKKLPSHLKSKVDVKKLTTFIDYLEGGDNLSSSARAAKIPTALAVELMSAIDKLGLL